MIVYYDLSIPVRCLIILGLFLAVCVGGHFWFLTLRRKNQLPKRILPLIILMSAIMMIIYTAEARANLRTLEIPAISKWLCQQSLVIPVSLLAAATVYYGYLMAEEVKFRKSSITRSSIKEGVDKISSGLCFYMECGRVILTNSRMSEPCHEIIGRDLQNADQFWQIHSVGEIKTGVERLSYGRYPVFRLKNVSVWTFARQKLDGFLQLTAADTTIQQTLTEQLRDKNRDLMAMNLRLRRYSENVDELARAKERLETKVRIHGELGQALLAARRYLMEQSSQDAPLDIWRRNIAMLRKEMETQKVDDPLHILEKAAKSAGVHLKIQGHLPVENEYRQFFLIAASEALTNAVVHADARTLYINLEETDSQWKIRFTNDGKKPGTAIIEGGGLGSLRRKTENIGASMKVESLPEFVLTITGGKGAMG